MKRLALWLFLLSGLLSGCEKAPPTNPLITSNEPDEDVPGLLNEVLASNLPPEVKKKLDENDLPGALQIIDETLAKEPNNTKVLVLAVRISQLYASRNAETNPELAYPMMKRSVVYLYSLKKGGDSGLPKMLESEVFYNAACAYAREGKKDDALNLLKECLPFGLPEIEILDTDEDLQSIRNLPEFKDLVIKFKQQEIIVAKQNAQDTINTTKSFPFDFKLNTIEGKPVALTDYAGKILIVDIWGTWCPPCGIEIPHFIELHKKYRDQGFEIVGINYEDGSQDEMKTTIKNFVTANGITYPCVIGDQTTQDQVPDFKAYPTTLFIDRSGKVRAKLVGLRTLAELEALVTILLDEKK